MSLVATGSPYYDPIPPAILHRLASFNRLTHLNIKHHSFDMITATLLINEILRAGAGRNLQSFAIDECRFADEDLGNRVFQSIGEWVFCHTVGNVDQLADVHRHAALAAHL